MRSLAGVEVDRAQLPPLAALGGEGKRPAVGRPRRLGLLDARGAGQRARFAGRHVDDPDLRPRQVGVRAEAEGDRAVRRARPSRRLRRRSRRARVRPATSGCGHGSSSETTASRLRVSRSTETTRRSSPEPHRAPGLDDLAGRTARRSDDPDLAVVGERDLRSRSGEIVGVVSSQYGIGSRPVVSRDTAPSRAGAAGCRTCRDPG